MDSPLAPTATVSRRASKTQTAFPASCKRRAGGSNREAAFRLPGSIVVARPAGAVIPLSTSSLSSPFLGLAAAVLVLSRSEKQN